MHNIYKILDELSELEKKATKGPCTFERLPQDWDGDASYRIDFPSAVSINSIDDARYYNSAPQINDAELFAALRNSWPTLRAALLASERDAARYRWIRQWAGRADEFPIDMTNPDTPEQMDAQIDAALLSQPESAEKGGE